MSKTEYINAITSMNGIREVVKYGQNSANNFGKKKFQKPIIEIIEQTKLEETKGNNIDFLA